MCYCFTNLLFIIIYSVEVNSLFPSENFCVFLLCITIVREGVISRVLLDELHSSHSRPKFISSQAAKEYIDGIINPVGTSLKEHVIICIFFAIIGRGMWCFYGVVDYNVISKCDTTAWAFELWAHSTVQLHSMKNYEKMNDWLVRELVIKETKKDWMHRKSPSGNCNGKEPHLQQTRVSCIIEERINLTLRNKEEIKWIKFLVTP